MAARFGMAASSPGGGRCWRISAVVGLLAGGRRTALVMRQPGTVPVIGQPSAPERLGRWRSRNGVQGEQLPATSPVNGLPVRLAPFPGARPTTNRRADKSPKAGTGRTCQRVPGGGWRPGGRPGRAGDAGLGVLE